jgi:hypothetical protein
MWVHELQSGPGSPGTAKQLAELLAVRRRLRIPLFAIYIGPQWKLESLIRVLKDDWDRAIWRVLKTAANRAEIKNPAPHYWVAPSHLYSVMPYRGRRA